MTPGWTLSRRALPASLLLLVQAARAQLPSGDDPEASVRWRQIRPALFGTRAIATAQDPQLTLGAPRRADDPAFVPLALRSTIAPDAANALRRLWLVIDNNPSPIAAIFDLNADGALPELETRARIDEYSFVRAIAETADGRLLMATRFVKASGGCSAPPGGDEAAMLAAMGRMRFRASEPAREGELLTVQWQVNHPNHSGMAMDQLKRTFTPAHYVRTVRITQGDRLLLSADVDFALSENPTLRFRFKPRGAADLAAEVVDTHERRYSGRTPLSELQAA